MSQTIQNHLNEDQMINLLHGLLPENQDREALEHLQDCEPCENEFQSMAADRERAYSKPQPYEKNNQVVIDPRHVAPRQGFSWHRRATAALAVAATVILMLTPQARDRFFSSGNDSRESQYWLPIGTETALLRSSPLSDPGKQALTRGLKAYGEHDAKTSIAYLESLEATDTDETIRRLFLASALTHDGQLDRAMAILDSISVDTMPQPWRRYGRWVLYVALKNSQDYEAAARVLGLLREEPGEIGIMAREEIERRK